MLCKLKCCQKCGGDLVLDGDEWRCWQCGHYYYPRALPGALPAALPAKSTSPTYLVQEPEVVEPLQRRRRSRRELRNINSLIVAKDRSEERWWMKNREVIRYLDEGRTVKEIARLVSRGERQIRVIRERLNDIRSGAEEAHQRTA